MGLTCPSVREATCRGFLVDEVSCHALAAHCQAHAQKSLPLQTAGPQAPALPAPSCERARANQGATSHELDSRPFCFPSVFSRSWEPSLHGTGHESSATTSLVDRGKARSGRQLVSAAVGPDLAVRNAGRLLLRDPACQKPYNWVNAHQDTRLHQKGAVLWSCGCGPPSERRPQGP